MSKPSYPQQTQNGQQMYQASDGKWYPVAQMPQGWDQNRQQQQGYYGQQPMGYGQGYQQPGYQQGGQPIYVQQRPGYGGGGGVGAGTGCLAALCGALLCFDLGACLF